MDAMATLTVEHFEQRVGQVEGRITHLDLLLVERFDRRLAETRAELLKWSFLFWVGQVAAVAAMLAFAPIDRTLSRSQFTSNTTRPGVTSIRPFSSNDM
jgi:hypothetical protein